MLTVIGDVLDPHRLAALREAAAGLDYVDGKATAGGYARDVKANLQAAASEEREAIFEVAREAILANEVVRSMARPRQIAQMLLSRSQVGMGYGTHVDNPIMNGSRTDLSFTLPLSAPEDYDGGELVIEDETEERAIRLDAGDMVLYPTSALHRVNPVTRGERLAIVGWVTSWVRDPARREVLHDLDVAAREMFASHGKSPAFDRLFKAKSNLMRMWADD